ncbi:hypothetical protein BpHYR1_052351 [Brachionus plicatilis]|uniref:Uncharacterized protein n=1 Tax=Brachionus plicatilis TaxID=10195 RepID=A0A3M7S9Y6_BRAPC|nr:hypothetical protein BpHYR1_052351 [Brachionus plicatilis]
MTGISRIAVVAGLGINCCAYVQGFTVYQIIIKSANKLAAIITKCRIRICGRKSQIQIKLIDYLQVVKRVVDSAKCRKI